MSHMRKNDRLTDPSKMSLVNIKSKNFILLDYSASGFAMEMKTEDLSLVGDDIYARIYFQGRPLIASTDLSVQHITPRGKDKFKVGVQFNNKLDQQLLQMMTTVGTMRPHAHRDTDTEKGIKV